MCLLQVYWEKYDPLGVLGKLFLSFSLFIKLDRYICVCKWVYVCMYE